MHGPDLPGANSPAGIVRDAAGRVVRALTTGISDAVGKERRLISETRASAGMLFARNVTLRYRSIHPPEH